jgi:hypothetical protein
MKAVIEHWGRNHWIIKVDGVICGGIRVLGNRHNRRVWLQVAKTVDGERYKTDVTVPTRAAAHKIVRELFK